jgi:hypothetical protein
MNQAKPKSEMGWTVPPLKKEADTWHPPKLSAPRVDEKKIWAVPPMPQHAPSDDLVRYSPLRLPRLRYWHAIVLVGVVAIVANREKLPGLWAEVFYRKPAEEWIRATALQKMPEAFANGSRLNFEIEAVHPLRESPGLASVTVTGRATTRESLYEAILVTDPVVGVENKLRELRGAEDRARFLLDHAGVQLQAVDENAFHFVKETTPTGQSARFDFEFEARRDRFEWHLEKISSASVTPTTAFLGKPIADLGQGAATPAVLGSDDARSKVAELTKQIDDYLAAISDAEKTAKKRFAAEGRDEKGNYLFPPNDSLPGERFAVTRMRALQVDELQNWSEDDVQYAVNELFARHGAEFPDKKLATWFHQFNWYHPKPKLSFDAIENNLPDIESQNVKTLGYVRNIKRENARTAAAQQAQAIAMAQAQQQQWEAQQRAQQEAAIRAQQEEAARQMIGNLLQGIANSIPR